MASLMSPPFMVAPSLVVDENSIKICGSTRERYQTNEHSQVASQTPCPWRIVFLILIRFKPKSTDESGPVASKISILACEVQVRDCIQEVEAEGVPSILRSRRTW
jgi:hypothetical protein